MQTDCRYQFPGPPPSSAAALATLADPVACWFRTRFGGPTVAQRLTWPALASGEHLLLGAPTGSGKTLAAFLPIIGQLLAAPMPGTIGCVYVAPLKALVRDVCANLRACLEHLQPQMTAEVSLPRAATRTGDSSPASRRQLWREPPDILLTTPETLALLLAHSLAAALFHDLRWVVIDEIHALAPSKRGADLSLSIERLTALAAGPVQRIGLSATCAPRSVAAAFLAGSGLSCTIVHVPETAPLHLDIELLAESVPASPRPRVPLPLLPRLLDRLVPELVRNRTTLIFTNRRGLAERLVWALRQRFPGWAEEIAVHHSSVAAERRRTVERRLKAGQLRVVVSSTSLELGIDIGTVDAVVLVHPPGGAVRLLQRVGRAGHAPGRPRRGLVLTATAAELLDATVTAGSSQSGQWEELRIPVHPLDVLCQQLLGMAAQRSWSPDDAFALVRRAAPYRDLPRADFDDCLAYLAGRHRDGSAWLPARLHLDGSEFSLADECTLRLLRRNLGTIIADEERPVVTEMGTNEIANGEFTAVGHLDEAFADRLNPGDRFLLDGRCLEYRRADGRSLVVEETVGRPSVPRWEGNGWPLSADLARRLYLLRTRAAEMLREGSAALARMLRDDYDLDQPAAAALVDMFLRQESVSEIPEEGALLVEVVPVSGGLDYYVHTPLNRAGNDALARVAIRRMRRSPAASLAADLGFRLSTMEELSPDELLALLAASDFDEDLAAAIAESETLRERFRCAALTGLMLLRNPLGRRRRVGGRDWAERQLFEQVRAADPDFVLLRQARREVHGETLDADAARKFAKDLPHRELRWRVLAQPSPLAEGWTQAEAGPAAAIETPAEALQRLHAELTRPG